MAPAVVLADAAPGAEFDVVQRLLEDGFGLPVQRIRATELPQTMTLEAHQGEFTIDEQPIRPVITWVRHATAAAVYSHRVRTLGATECGLQDAECWVRLLTLLTSVADLALPGQPPEFGRQLRDAVRHGVTVPATVVGNDVDAARRLLSARSVIAKVPDARLMGQLAGGSDMPTPVIIESADSHPDWMTAGYPVVFQEYIDHARELRIYYVDGAVFAFEVDKPAASSLWTEPARVSVQPVPCPDRIADTVRRLSRTWNLRFGAFDFLITHSNEPVFLEVNVDGDWIWCERRTGTNPVTFMVATMVAERYARVLAAKAV